jgi:hypothetical protein
MKTIAMTQKNNNLYGVSKDQVITLTIVDSFHFVAKAKENDEEIAWGLEILMPKTKKECILSRLY